MSRCKAVLFDAGQTLLRVRTSVGQVYSEVAGHYGVHVDHAALQQAFQKLFQERLGEFHEGSSEEAERAWWRALVWDTFTEVGSLGPLESLFGPFFDELYALFATAEPWLIYGDVVPTLEALRSRGIGMAVVSNWDRRLNVLAERLGLSRYFAFVLTSAEAGVRKPHPAIFNTALERLGLRPQDAIHVGDSLGDDYHGAVGTGMSGLLLVREGRNALPPVPTIHSLLELPGLLGLT